ncbi:hypothetical protein AB8O55_24765 [Saccharopolyspora cebuensis]|uniref:Uncharacterized protein n=1 Tax=Saccharopolyspora cebuensis TaxID=418759 RepID=A0ABV4CNG6_9PSEU
MAALLRAGDLRAARAQWLETLTSADEVECVALIECGRILVNYPRTAVEQLRAYWHRTRDERVRAVIVACAPRPGESPQRPEPQPDRAPRWDRRAIEQARHRAGGPVRTEVRPELRRTRRKARPESRTVAEYAATRAEVDDAPQRGTQPDGYALDYDTAAVYPVMRDRERPDPRRSAVREGRPCVALGCNLMPSAADRTHRDGLCQECRELDRPGVEVPESATRAQMIEALCAYIHQHYPRALDHLRREWSRYSNAADRATVAAWVEAHTDPDAEPPAAPALAGCQTCGDDRSPRDLRHLAADDGQCAGCRALESDPAPAVTPSATADEPATEAEPVALAA